MEIMAAPHTSGASELEVLQDPPDLPYFEPVAVEGRPFRHDQYEGINRLANLDAWDECRVPLGYVEPLDYRGVIEVLRQWLENNAPRDFPRHLKEQRIRRL